MTRLALYELDVREPVAELDDGGQLHRLVGGAPTSGLPKILFADVPIMLHLTCGISVAPMDQASEETGPDLLRLRMVVQHFGALGILETQEVHDMVPAPGGLRDHEAVAIVRRHLAASTPGDRLEIGIERRGGIGDGS